jgi:hypothetical protein
MTTRRRRRRLCNWVGLPRLIRPIPLYYSTRVTKKTKKKIRQEPSDDLAALCPAPTPPSKNASINHFLHFTVD